MLGYQTNDYIAMGCNLSTPALQDQNVRQAMSYALDRQALINVVFNGQAQVSTMMPPAMGHWSLDAGSFELYQFNLDKAKELMEAAGYSDSNGLSLKLAAGLMDSLRQAAALFSSSSPRSTSMWTSPIWSRVSMWTSGAR